MRNEYMAHLLPKGDEFDEVFLFGDSPEEVRKDDDYKSYIEDDNFKEQAMYQLTLISGNELLPHDMTKH